jgi:hypothetical protein
MSPVKESGGWLIVDQRWGRTPPLLGLRDVIGNMGLAGLGSERHLWMTLHENGAFGS